MAWTYFSPELTLKEMELVEKKVEEYMRSFKLLNNADVNETEMKESSSSSKYVIAYCRRKTITIDSQNLLGAKQESNSTNEENSTPSIDSNVTNSSDIVELRDHEIMETCFTSITEEEALLGQKNIAERLNVSQKLVLLCISILVLIIGGTVGLSINFIRQELIVKGLSPICEDEECLDVNCSDSCNHCKNYKRISIDGDLNITKSSCLGINERNCTAFINRTPECQPVMSLFMIGGLSVASTRSPKNYNLAFPRLVNTYFEFENGPVSRDENIMQHYQYGRLPKSAISTSFCSIQIKDEIFILGGDATYGDQGVNVFKIETARNVYSGGGQFVPVFHQIVELDWKLPLPFIKHVCSAVRNFEIWLCSTDAQIDHGCMTCVATTVDGEKSRRRYLSHSHVSGNLITIQDGELESLVIIGGRNARVPGEENIIAIDEVEFCDEGMSFS